MNILIEKLISILNQLVLIKSQKQKEY